MARRQTHGATFQETLARVSERNAAALMRRARLANRLAKTSERHGRRNAYAVKVRALSALRERFPERVTVLADPMLPRFVVVAIPAARFGLHAPVEVFAAGGDRCAA
jgi:hypothetical protein